MRDIKQIPLCFNFPRIPCLLLLYYKSKMTQKFHYEEITLLKTFKIFHHISYLEVELARVWILRFHPSNRIIVILWYKNFNLVCNNTLELSKVKSKQKVFISWGSYCFSSEIMICKEEHRALKTWKAPQLYQWTGMTILRDKMKCYITRGGGWY